MSQLTIVTTPQNSGLGTPLATSFNYCNSNFTELYARAQTSPPSSLIGQNGDVSGMYAYDSAYFYYCFANYDGSTQIWGQVTQIGNITVPIIQNGTSNVSVGLNSNVTVGVNGISNVAVFATNGAYVKGIVSATGNVKGAYILGDGSQLSGLPQSYTNANVAAFLPFYVGNIDSVINVTASNTITSSNIVANTNVSTAGIMSAVGNIVTDSYFVGNFFGNITGNFVIPGSNTQVVFNTNGNADARPGLTFNTAGPNLLTVLGTVSATANIIGGNLTTAGQLSVGGNITSGANITSSGYVAASNGVVSTNTYNGPFSDGIVVDYQNGNGRISVGAADGLIIYSGGVANTAVITISPTGTITTNGNLIGGNILISGLLSAPGNITGGNLTVGNIAAGGNISATGYTGTSSSVVGNVTGGNLLTGGYVSAVGNIVGNYIIGNGSQLTGVTAYTNANVIALLGNLGSNNISTTGSVTTASLIGGVFTGFGASVSGDIIGSTLTGTLQTAFQPAITAVGILANLSLSGDITSNGNILTTAVISSTGDITTGSNLVTSGTTVNSGVSTSGNVTGGNILTGGLISSTGNITGGNLSVSTGTITVGNIVNSNANGVGNIGSSSNYFNKVFATATTALYADLAEIYVADVDYEPGTVVVFGGDKEITVTAEFANVSIAGAISTDPAYLMNSATEGLPVALRGRIPVKVVGPVYKGDLLVTAGANPGYAVSIGQSTDYPLAVFAKSIETNTNEGVKVITAVIL